ANYERVNARDLDATDLPHPDYPLVVMDLSFISVRKVLPAVWRRVAQSGHLIVLVKPQFESSRAEAGRGRGVIRDDAIRTRVLGEVRDFVRTTFPDADEVGVMESPISGADGNMEFLVGWQKSTMSLQRL